LDETFALFLYRGAGFARDFKEHLKDLGLFLEHDSQQYVLDYHCGDEQANSHCDVNDLDRGNFL
jgi:hypothetical protein